MRRAGRGLAVKWAAWRRGPGALGCRVSAAESGLHIVSPSASGLNGSTEVWFIPSHGGGSKAQRREAHWPSHTASDPSNGPHSGLEPTNHGLVIMGVGEG